MSIRLEMLQVARLAPKLLGESAELVRSFVQSQQAGDGGFNGRTGQSDLYYTVFAIDALLALRAKVPWEELGRYLRSFGTGEGQDFVHLCCLARCHNAWSGATRQPLPSALASSLAEQIEAHRTPEGGYNPLPDSEIGTAYGSFLALSAYQDLGQALPRPEGLVQSLKRLETSDGAWANTSVGTGAVGSTNATAAAATALRTLGVTPPSRAAAWLLGQVHPQGGFRAWPQAPIPDLLSTATSLHALTGFGQSLTEIKEACLDFIDTLWTNEGGFHGNWTDDFVDCEYTYYGLLALGHLSL